MRLNLPLFIVTIMLIASVATPSLATGPSTATIQIMPISYNNEGVILCKTSYFINRTGGAASQRVEYGWLAVSASGIWEEVIHVVVEDAYNPVNEGKLAKYTKEFDDGLNWKSPPESVKPLIRKYSFQDRGQTIESNNTITWSPNRICMADKCIKVIAGQRSLKNLKSVAKSGSTVSSYFFHAGVALFHNSYGPETEKLVGGDIFISNVVEGEDVGIDYWEIDGISVIKDSIFKTK